MVLWAAASLAGANAFAAQADAATECIVPSKPGGGFDLTCKLVRKGMAVIEPAAASMHLSYLPGGIGAVAWNMVISQRRAGPNTVVAFSGGSLMNMALGKFGRFTTDDVRWVAGIGTDYGMIAVRRDSPYKTLRELVEAIRKDPSTLPVGGGGTIGSQDWIKMGLLAKAVGGDPRKLRFVAFEGGGEAFTALMAGHVQVVSGDASEAVLHLASGDIRVLAVLADARLPGVLQDVPTAREQGFDLSWPIIRGVYMGPDVSDADYQAWVRRFDRMMSTPAFDRLRAEHGLYPFAMTGAAFTGYVKKTVEQAGKQARDLGLLR
ncbi:tripartite tricarboxylate transporter substrate binding protein [Noviherbaspirillum galbum]|uniref:Tripartite tricarboxylate transporter substrate binding protein n=1 Tax=Noviherbaspirillum galbum TaxID=2709383 RepID=A0A6B3SY78_9BURK|nr:tripartite tricarboxylate transporter substrate-binding protein [Noviherbaspirillum galbum]NEX63582.1 tripartite tricarboxylate transporter substrate binding protein [Noviherbaspirillum galbum]